MKIISVAHHGKDAHDFSMCVVNDEIATATFKRAQRANHQNIYSLAMFSPDNVEDFITYIQHENDELLRSMESEK